MSESFIDLDAVFDLLTLGFLACLFGGAIVTAIQM
jgi:hypothetical protein